MGYKKNFPNRRGAILVHVVIAGGSGFIGKALQERLINDGNQVTILTRNPEKVKETEQLKAVQWLVENSEPEEQLHQVDAIVNLAGESINGVRWTKSKKKRILDSRMTATREIIRIISALEVKPQVLVNGSAVGFYGMSDTEIFTEQSTSVATDFLATVVKMWEAEAMHAEQFGVRTVFARFGVVLGKEEGALPLMVLPYKMGVGGTIGSGKQWLSWIHVADAAGLLHFAVENPEIIGAINVTAPEPAKMREFGKTIGRVLRRPHWLPVLSFAMKTLLGEMSDMLLRGQCAIPEKAMLNKYEYRYQQLEKALENILKD